MEVRMTKTDVMDVTRVHPKLQAVRFRMQSMQEKWIAKTATRRTSRLSYPNAHDAMT